VRAPSGDDPRGQRALCDRRPWRDSGARGAVVRGRIVRFDQVKGYGFVTPDGGGEDVFLHVNDLLDEKYLMVTGAVVEFVSERGERGPKASAVRLVSSPRAGGSRPAERNNGAEALGEPVVVGEPGEPGEEYLDVLAEQDFLREVTELLLRVEPGLTGPQVLGVRRRLVELGRKYGWLVD